MCAASAARPTSIGGLPTRLPDGAPSSSTRPSADQLADQVGDGHPGQAGAAGEVGAAGRSVPEQLLEQQGAVVAAGVLLQQLAAGAERAADR